ncbi:MAG: succinate-semialdehyde dehydrogenase (NADP(+)), partial [Betaproteobacteria bacterium]
MLQQVKTESPKLNDPKLFRQQCYIDGAWIDADDKSTITVVNPANGTVVGTVPR